MNYPKLLIVGTEDVYKDNSSSSYTVRSLVDNWPKDRIRQIVCNDNSNFDGTTYVLHDNDILLNWKIARKRVRPSSIKRNESHYYSKHNHSIKTIVKRRLVSLYSCLPYKYCQSLRQFIQAFTPEVVYCCSARFRVFHLAQVIAMKSKIPFIPHFFDDWPNVAFDASCLWDRWMYSNIKKAISNAPIVFCISELMCEEYRNRYNYDRFYELMHSVNPLPRINIEKEKPFTLLYAGSIYLGRYKSLIEICHAIKNRDEEIELIIYTSLASWEELGGEFSGFPFVHYGGYISQSELMNRITEADGLIFVESFDEELLVYSRLSMSTKIPEYLSSGNPILAIGHESQGSISYLKSHNAAYVATNKQMIPSVFKSFIDKDNYADISIAAEHLFMSNHQRDKQQLRFLNLIKECMN